MISEYYEILKNDKGEYKTHQFIVNNNLNFIIGKCNFCNDEKALIGPIDICDHKYCVSCYVSMGFHGLTVECPSCKKDITSWVREIMLIKTKYINNNTQIYNPNYVVSLNHKIFICISSIIFVSSIIGITTILSGPISPIMSAIIISSIL